MSHKIMQAINEEEALVEKQDKPVALRMESINKEMDTLEVPNANTIATNNNNNNNDSNSYAKLVWVRIEFLTFGEVDTFNEKYQAEVKIRSKWYDEGDIEEYDRDKHWYPKLYIENAMHDVKEEIKYTVTKLEDKVMITETRTAKGSFWERIELQNFPLDVQELSITFASKYKPTKVKLVADPLKISNIHSEAPHTFRDQQKWKLYKMVRVSETASYDIGSMKAASYSNITSDFHKVSFSKSTNRPKFVATSYVSRRPEYYLINIYSFNFLITALSLTIFAIETRLAQNRISGTFTLILTSVSFKFVSNRALPTVSYLTSLDRYQMISIVYLASCCVWHSSISTVNLDMPQKTVIDRSVLLLFATVFLLIQVVFGVQIFISYNKIKEIEKAEAKFLKQMELDGIDLHNHDDSDDEDDSNS